MKIQKIFQYAYLVFAILFLYDAIDKWTSDRQNEAYMMLLFTALAVFMFFFRKRFIKKIEDRNKK